MSSHSPGHEPPEEVLRISRVEVLGAHVDDLLKRQKSLRGESGVTRGRRGWYYQNWFVLMLVGGLSSFAAWALLEPYFDDLFYVQGAIERLSESGRDQLTSRPARGPSPPVQWAAWDRGRPRIGPAAPRRPAQERLDPDFLLRALPMRGWVEIGGERLWMLEGSRTYGSGPQRDVSGAGEFQVGQTIGVWVEAVRGLEGVYLARFVAPSPPELARPRLPLERQIAQSQAAGLLLFPLVAGLVGLGIGAADGIICRLPRRALLGGGVGLLVGFVGGFISHILAGLIYAPLNHLALQQQGDAIASLTAFGFSVQMVGRGLAWLVAGVAMGLGQGIALRSGRLLLYGLLGGILGGLLGGLLFDPIDLILLGPDKPSAHLSRMIGLTIIGGTVGAMIGVVELLARDAWLRMVEGPLVGKEFLMFKDLMKIGASPRCDIYLFNDPLVAPHHASLRSVGEDCEIESAGPAAVEINGHPCRRSRLRHADRITIGRTSFVFEKRGN